MLKETELYTYIKMLEQYPYGKDIKGIVERLITSINGSDFLQKIETFKYKKFVYNQFYEWLFDFKYKFRETITAEDVEEYYNEQKVAKYCERVCTDFNKKYPERNEKEIIDYFYSIIKMSYQTLVKLKEIEDYKKWYDAEFKKKVALREMYEEIKKSKIAESKQPVKEDKKMKISIDNIKEAIEMGANNIAAISRFLDVSRPTVYKVLKVKKIDFLELKKGILDG